MHRYGRSGGTAGGVVSKFDCLYGTSHAVVASDLRLFFDLAAVVLSEDDPALDFPPEQRWLAGLYEKRRKYSPALRKGIAESIVLLAVHGKDLFFDRTGIACELEAGRLVRRLLTPMETRVLQANDRDLMAYAEASPEEFLSILEADLLQDEPQIFGLLKDVSGAPFGGGCTRAGLLWALEGLSWSTLTLDRAATVLARLSSVELNDNWSNKPFNSLAAIFRSWMPQTGAGLDHRLSLAKQLTIRFPSVMWKVFLEEFDGGPRSGSYSHKPQWRNDGYGYGEPLREWGPALEFCREVLDLMLAWRRTTLRTCSATLSVDSPRSATRVTKKGFGG
ncbi:MAG: hypothetical protein IPP98_12910 [Gemmatimonadetes bacterium]|nr:hypothetical protein [Gemmatimonadota bacterium]